MILLFFLFTTTLQQGTDAGEKAAYSAQQSMKLQEALAAAAPYAAMGIPVNIKIPSPPPPSEPVELFIPTVPSEYDDLFTYKGYFDPYPDDVNAFMIHGRRRKRHRINCGRDRKGRHCDFRRSHHQHGFYNKECTHYAGSLEIYGVWQCGSRFNMREGAIVRLMVELHELVLKYQQDKNNYAMERFSRILQFNDRVYSKMKDYFYTHAKKDFKKVIMILNETNLQVIKNFQSIFDMSKQIIDDILKGRQVEVQELIDQLQALLEDYPPPQSICNQIHDCGLCISRPGCVFCTEEVTCNEGSKVFGAYYNTCDLWIQNDQCPESDEGYVKKVSYKDELFDFAEQEDLDLDQKMFIVSKQREMINLKNQIETRRQVMQNIKNMYQNIRNRNIKVMDQYMKEQGYDGHFLDQVDDEKAEGGLKKLLEEVDDLEQEEQDMEAEEKAKEDKEKEMDQEAERKKQQQFSKRYKAIKIDKKKYEDIAGLQDVIKKENDDLNQE